MAWQIEITPDADKALARLDTITQKRIVRFLRQRVARLEDPREIGAPLRGNLREFWRYRVGDYRVLCRLEDNIVTVFVVHIGHRSGVYKK